VNLGSERVHYKLVSEQIGTLQIGIRATGFDTEPRWASRAVLGPKM
jgi:hypothetical protein